MLIIKHGDVLKAFIHEDYNCLMHGCNCFCTMGKGIAASIKQLYPTVYQEDRKTTRGDKNKLGKIFPVEVKTNKFVINAYTQYGIWDRVNINYKALENCFEKLRLFCSNHNYSVCIPAIGAGLAGGNLETIKNIISNIFTDRDIYLYLLK